MTKKILKTQKQTLGVSAGSYALMVFVSVSNKNVDGEDVVVNDSHLQLAMGSLGATLSQHGYVPETSAYLLRFPPVELKEGESLRVVNLATLEQTSPDVVETEAPDDAPLDDEAS